MGNPPPAGALAALLAPSSKVTNRVEIYESDGVTRWTKDTVSRLISGSVGIDYNRDERRVLDLELDNSDFVLQNAPGEFWYDKVIKAFRGVQYKDKVTTPTQIVRTNLSTNPRFQTAGAPAVRRTNICKYPGFELGATSYAWRTNYALNPSCEASTGTVTRRTNWCVNPNFETDATTWTVSGCTIARDTSQFHSGAASGKVTSTAASGLSYVLSTSFINPPAAAGEVWTLSVWVKASGTVNAGKITLATYGVGGANLANFDSTTAVPSSSGWTRYTVTCTLPTNATQIKIFPWVWASTTSGQIVYIDDILIEKSAKADTYFDGSTTTTADLTYAWTGTTNLSTSTQTGTVVSNWTVTNGTIVKDTLISGLRWGTQAASCRSTGAFSIKHADVTAAAGDVWTISALVRCNAALTAGWQMAVEAYNGATLLQTYTTSFTTSSGTTGTINGAFNRISLTTGALPTNTTKIVVYPVRNTTATYGEEIWFDAVLIEKAAVLRDYFDGSNAPRYRFNRCTNPTFETNVTGWSGVVGYNAVTATRDTTIFRTGSASMKITWTYDGSHAKAAIQHTASGGDLVPGKTYTFSGWVYVPSGNPQVYAGELFSTWGLQTQAFDVWERVSVTFVATSNQHYFGFWANTNAGPGTFYIDDVMMEEAVDASQPAFSGADSSTLGYSYSWYGTSHASYSFQKNTSYTAAWTGTTNASTSTVSVLLPDGWNGFGCMAFRDFTQYVSGSTGMHVHGAGIAASPYYDTGAGSITPGVNYSFSARIHVPNPLATALAFVVNFYNSSGTFISSLPAVALGVGTTTTKFEKYSIYGVAPATADKAIFNFSTSGGGTNVLGQDEAFYVDQVLIEASKTAGPYFDGATSADGDYTYAWVGTANASNSTASTAIPTGWSAAGSPAPLLGQSTRYVHGAASKSLMIATAGQDSASPNAVSDTFTTVVGQTYIASAWAFIPTGSLLDWVAVYIPGVTTGDSNAFVKTKGEWKRLSVVWVATSTTSQVAFNCNMSTRDLAFQTCYVSEVLIETGNTLGNYFDGASVDAPNRDFVWTGSADASTSTETRTLNVVTYMETTWETQVGEFCIDTIKEDDFPHTIKITARDYVKRCLLSKFTQATQFATGQALETIISTIAANAGITKKVLPPTGVVVNRAFFYDRGVDRWTAMKEIANAYNYDIFFDGNGYLRLVIFNDPVLTASAFTYQTGLSGNMSKYTKSTNDSRLYNHVLVTGDSGDPAIPPVWAEAKNTDASSPTSISRIGDRLYQYSSSFITTQAQAQAVANTFLAIHALEEYELDFDAIVLPWFDTGEIITWIDPRPATGDPDRFLLSTMTIPLGLGTGSATGKRIVLVN